jgi:hypothetical protein
MAMIDCPECGRPRSTEAKACPACGHTIVRRRPGAVVLGVILIAIGLFVLFVAGEGYGGGMIFFLGTRLGLFALGAIAIGIVEVLVGFGKRITPW